MGPLYFWVLCYPELMTIPESLKIGAHTIQVKLEKLDSEDIDGDYDSRKGLIRIDADMPQTLQESTLIHEIFHALNATLGDGPVGHALLDSLSEQFYQVLKDNDLLK